MTLFVHKPGLLTTLQDPGRYGRQRFGVIASGAMDLFAHRAANLLVGNAAGEATLEMTLIGPVLEFQSPALIAVCGGDLMPTIDGKPVPQWRPVYVREGSVLAFGNAREGCRAYLAVAGGFAVKRWLGSYATYLRAGIGGFKGRALEAGDRLPLGPPSPVGRRIAARLAEKMQAGDAFGPAGWRVSRGMMPAYAANPTVRFIPGGQYGWFDADQTRLLETAEYVVSPQSDRMGYRLNGPPLMPRQRRELLSEPVAFGTVQVPPDGSPIVLMADRQTTGGYPKIAQVITADLPLLAQTRIGGKVRFRLVDLRKAQEVLLHTELSFALLEKQVRASFT